MFINMLKLCPLIKTNIKQSLHVLNKIARSGSLSGRVSPWWFCRWSSRDTSWFHIIIIIIIIIIILIIILKLPLRGSRTCRGVSLHDRAVKLFKMGNVHGHPFVCSLSRDHGSIDCHNCKRSWIKQCHKLGQLRLPNQHRVTQLYVGRSGVTLAVSVRLHFRLSFLVIGSGLLVEVTTVNTVQD